MNELQNGQTIPETQDKGTFKRFKLHLEELKQQNIWVNWEWAEVGGRKTKVPKNCQNGNNAQTNNPETWSSYGLALQNFQQYGAAGIGFCFAELLDGYALCGIDVDGTEGHTVENHNEQDVLKLFSATYAEKSPSGAGVHIIFCVQKNRLPIVNGKMDKRYYMKNGNNSLECYVAGLTNRYFTFTGNTVSSDDWIVDMTDEFLQFLEKYMLRTTTKKSLEEMPMLPVQQVSNQEMQTERNFIPMQNSIPENWLEKARNAGNGGKFIALYDIGDISEYNNDASRADLALCRILAFWLQGDSTQIDIAFRNSALCRQKWLEREDYRTLTISSAIELCNGEFYTPYKHKKEKSSGKQTQSEETESKQRLKFPDFVVYIQEHGYSMRYNQISHKIEFNGFDSQESPEHLEEVVPTILVDEMEDIFTSASKNRIQDYIVRHATRNRYNPVLEMIQSTEWDGKNYISEVFDIFKLSPDTEEGIYSRIFFQKWLMQCVCGLFNNIENPFSLDITLVFQGKQGIGKTRFFEKLALKSCFFGEGVCLDPRQKDSVEQTTDKWICELGEIGSTMRKDIDSLKAFLTKSTDEYRKSYGRAAIRYPRMVSFVGTVNDAEFLIDATGNRRFATVPLADDLKIDYEKQIKPFNALQMWAQVYNMVKDKDKASCFRLSDDEKAFLDRRNASFLKPLKGEYEVRDVISDLTCGNHTMRDISVTQFIQNNPILQKYSAKTISQVLDKMGIEQHLKRVNGTMTRIRTLPVKNFDKIY